MFRGHIWVNVKTSLLGYAINQVSSGHLIDFIRKVVFVSGLKIIFMKPNVFVAFKRVTSTNCDFTKIESLSVQVYQHRYKTDIEIC